MLYGGADEVLAAATGIRDLEKIREFKLGWNNRWPKSAAYMERARQETLRTMRVQTLFGRTLYIEDTNKELTEKHIGNTGIAFPSQGSAAEVFKRGLLMLVDAGFDPDIFVNNVHDDTWLNGRFTIPEEALSSISQVWTPVEVEYLTYGK
jgi:DNA polymerase I-like protein with 3'-5' exonuclease and polymerase domains